MNKIADSSGCSACPGKHERRCKCCFFLYEFGYIVGMYHFMESVAKMLK